MLMSFALDIARELRIPTMAFWTSSAASLITHMRLRQLQERGYVPLKGKIFRQDDDEHTRFIDQSFAACDVVMWMQMRAC